MHQNTSLYLKLIILNKAFSEDVKCIVNQVTSMKSILEKWL